MNLDAYVDDVAQHGVAGLSLVDQQCDSASAPVRGSRRCVALAGGGCALLLHRVMDVGADEAFAGQRGGPLPAAGMVMMVIGRSNAWAQGRRRIGGLREGLRGGCGRLVRSKCPTE